MTQAYPGPSEILIKRMLPHGLATLRLTNRPPTVRLWDSPAAGPNGHARMIASGDTWQHHLLITEFDALDPFPFRF
jgi:hypothetical protein